MQRLPRMNNKEMTHELTELSKDLEETTTELNQN